MEAAFEPADWLTREEAAVMLQISLKSLERRDRAGLAPRPYRMGPRCTRYSRAEVESLASAAATP